MTDTVASGQTTQSSRLLALANPESCNVYVCNLPLDTDLHNLEILAAPAQFQSARVFGSAPGNPRSVAFMRFADRETASQCIERLDGVTLPDGHALRARFADTPQQRQLKRNSAMSEQKPGSSSASMLGLPMGRNREAIRPAHTSIYPIAQLAHPQFPPPIVGALAVPVPSSTRSSLSSSSSAWTAPHVITPPPAYESGSNYVEGACVPLTSSPLSPPTDEAQPYAHESAWYYAHAVPVSSVCAPPSSWNSRSWSAMQQQQQQQQQQHYYQPASQSHPHPGIFHPSYYQPQHPHPPLGYLYPSGAVYAHPGPDGVLYWQAQS